MAEHVRVGLVGSGWWAEEFHVAGLGSHPRAVLAAVCGRDRARAEGVAARHGAPAVFTDYDEMLTSSLLDAVVIAVPDDLHRDMTLRALASGLHVLCEKPLARSAADAREMLDAASAAGRVHMVMFTWRWLGAFAYLHELVSDGYLGRCRDAHLRMQSSYAHDDTYGWRFDPDRGGGILADFGSHLIDLARWYLGDVTQVSASLTAHVGRRRPDGSAMASANDSACALLEFAGGARGTVEVSGVRVVGELPSYEIRLYGEEGSLEAHVEVESAHAQLRGRRLGDSSWADLPVPASLSAVDGEQPAILGHPLLAPLTNLPVGDRLFIDAILGGRPAEPSFEDGWRVQQIVDAAVRSARERCWAPVG